MDSQGFNLFASATGQAKIDDTELARELGRKLDVVQQGITQLISDVEEPVAMDRATVLADVREALQMLILVVFHGDTRDPLRGQPFDVLERACQNLANAELPFPMPRSIRDAKPEDFERGLHRARNALRRYCLDLVEINYVETIKNQVPPTESVQKSRFSRSVGSRNSSPVPKKRSCRSSGQTNDHEFFCA